MLEHDNLDEYRDSATYDAINGGFEHGGPFFLSLARECGNPILEIACGTGRLTVPLAEQGFDVTGVDITPEMLERAEHKAAERGVSVRFVQGDARKLQLNRQFRLIFTTGNSFQAFLTREAQEELLAAVREHLTTDGLFAFETRNPVAETLDAGTAPVDDSWSFVDHDGTPVTVLEQRWYDHASQIEHYTTRYQWDGGHRDRAGDPHQPSLCVPARITDTALLQRV